MSGSFKPSHYETPEERLKRMLLECLDDARQADASDKKKTFCVHIKHFLWLLKADIPDTIITAIEERHKALDLKKKEISAKADLSIADKEKQIIEAEYTAYTEDIIDGIDSMRNSKIMQRQMAGIILAGKTMADLNKLGERIRNSNAIETIIEPQEGAEDGGEVE